MVWPMIPLDKVAEIRGGATPSRNESTYWSGSIPWLTPRDLPQAGKGISTVEKTSDSITEKGLASSSASLLPPGTVLFSTRASIGKVGIATVPLTTNQGFANFIPRSGIQSRYLAWCLSFHADQIANLAGSTTFKEVTKSALRSFRIPLPPLPERSRIVEILDQADQLRRLRTEANAIADRVLPALFLKMFGDPSTNPMGWPDRPLARLLSPVDKRDPRAEPEQSFIYIDIAGVDGSSGDIVDTKILLGAQAPSRARQIVHAGDVLVSTVRPYLRATAIVPRELDGQICSTGFSVLRAKRKSGQGYLYALSRTHWFTDQLMARARGASYPAVTNRDIWEMQVPLPNDQVALSRCDRAVEAILENRSNRKNAKNRIDALFNLLLDRVFASSLTESRHEARNAQVHRDLKHQTTRIEASPLSQRR